MSAPATGLKRWLTTTNHKDVGILYLYTSLAFFFIGGLLILLVRTQLAQPENDFLKPDTYNQAITMHGAIMLLLFLSPFTFAFANYFVPLQIGARDLAFPRMNALSYWLYLAAGLVAASGFATGGAANTGWTLYWPLSSKAYNPGLGVDLAALGLVLIAASSTVSTINFLVTIFRYRAKGMSLWHMPMFTWGILFTLIITLFAFPALAGGLLMLLTDRNFGTSFFTADTGGSLLWGHIFWFFGHPEVYILLLPAMGVVAEIVSTFARRPLYGKNTIVYAFSIATFLSFIVWVHHMFITGTDPVLRKLMTITTESISIPFGVIYLCLIATLWGGRIRFRTPMLFALGFIGLFLMGGLTGVFLSSVALDYNFRGTYYVVAHFHYTLVGGAVVGMLAGLYYWYPKMTGRMFNERLGQAHFWASFVGFNVTFLSQFAASDMPRRIVTYAADSGWTTQNLLSTVGAFIFGGAQLIMVYNLLWSLKRGARAGPDPWGAPGLEWTIPSPPPAHNFAGEPTLRRAPPAVVPAEPTAPSNAP